MAPDREPDPRPDVEAALRGRDATSGMDGEATISTSSMDEALFWTQVYREIWAMEKKVLARVEELMETQSDTARREVELTNVPVIQAQAARFRERLGFWEDRLLELDGTDSQPGLAGGALIASDGRHEVDHREDS